MLNFAVVGPRGFPLFGPGVILAAGVRGSCAYAATGASEDYTIPEHPYRVGAAWIYGIRLSAEALKAGVISKLSS